jgi:hypothetical protein
MLLKFWFATLNWCRTGKMNARYYKLPGLQQWAFLVMAWQLPNSLALQVFNAAYATQVADCWTDYESWKALKGCETVFANAASNMAKLFSGKPTSV